MALYFNFKKKARIPSLQELCIQVLIDHRDEIGDLGAVPAEFFTPVLSHCSPEELQRIEDLTMEKSGRDISWDTWQLWKRIYQQKYGKPNPEEVPQLRCNGNGEVDRDRLPEHLGDYRRLYERKVRQTEQQKKKISEKLKNIKQKQNLTKEKSKAKRIGTVDLKKNRRRASSARMQTPFNQEKKSRGGISGQAFYESLGLTRKSKTIAKIRRLLYLCSVRGSEHHYQL